MAAEVAAGGDGGEGVLQQHIAHCHRLCVTMFQQQRAARGQAERRVGDDLGQISQAVVRRHQRRVRLETQVALAQVRVVRGDVGRVADDEVEALSLRQRRKPVADAKLDRAAAGLRDRPPQPPLIGALLFVARTGDAATGGLALFSLALGMGAPLLAIGTSLGKLVPKPGPFLNVVQMLFGFILLGFAIWLLDRVVLGHVTMLLAGALIGALCIVLFRIVRGAGVWPLAARALNSLVLAYAVLLAANASVGGENWLRPWHFEARQAAHASALPFERHRSLGDIQHGIRAAADRQQWTMLVFYADWCVSCKELEAFTFSDAEVQRLLTDAALLEADVTESDGNSRELLGRFSLYGPPAILFFDSAAREVEWARIVGFVGADDFAEHLGKVFGYGSASTR